MKGVRIGLVVAILFTIESDAMGICLSIRDGYIGMRF